MSDITYLYNAAINACGLSSLAKDNERLYGTSDTQEMYSLLSEGLEKLAEDNRTMRAALQTIAASHSKASAAKIMRDIARDSLKACGA